MSKTIPINNPLLPIREDLEKAYALLAGYYSQLQEAYNVLYTQQQQQQHANLQHERMLHAAASAEVRDIPWYLVGQTE